MVFIPNIGTRGIYKLLAPFDQLILENVPYECIAVRRLADVIGAGTEPMDTYYTSVGLSETDYNNDVRANACLISLQASVGHLLVVPSTYIDGHPDIGGVPYTRLILAASLGPVPDNMDLTPLQSKVTAIVQEYIGITPEIDIVACSLQAIVSNDEHERIEEARKNNVSNAGTDYAKYLGAQTKLEAAFARIRELETHIIANRQPQQP